VFHYIITISEVSISIIVVAIIFLACNNYCVCLSNLPRNPDECSFGRIIVALALGVGVGSCPPLLITKEDMLAFKGV